MAKLTGTNPDQVPTNADLGDMAYQSKDNASISKIDVPNEGNLTLNPSGGKVGINTDTPYVDLQIGDGTETVQVSLVGPNSNTSSSSLFFADNLTDGTQAPDFLGMSIGYNSDQNSLNVRGHLGETPSPELVSILRATGEVQVTSGLLELDGNDIGGTQVTIADDAVASITPPRNGGFMFITAGLTGGQYPQQSRSGMVFFDAGASLEIQERITASALDVSTSDVTGTTGTDGNITVAVQSGVIKIENRGGSTHVFDITFL